MRKTFLRIVSVLCTTVMLMGAMSVAVSAFDYRTGSGSLSDSYKNGHYYQNLQRIELTGDGVTDVLAVALSQLGYQEDSSTLSGMGSGSGNHTEYNRNTGLSHGEAWCAAFCSWSLYQSGVSPHNDSSSWVRNHRGDYNYIWCDPGCANWANQLKGAGLYGTRESGYVPKSGDLIFFNNNGINHIGIVVWCDGSRVYTIEGNTSSAEGLDGEGGGVYYKSYLLTNDYINGYGKLPYAENPNAPKVDYSGNNMTAGQYIVRTGKSLSADSFNVPAHHMFEVKSISGSTATIEYNGQTGTATLSKANVLQVTATGASNASSDIKFGLTEKGITVNKDGSWSMELYLENANDLFAYDAWYGIYDLGVKADDLESGGSALSQGAWDYVISKSDETEHIAGLEEGDRLPSKRFTFTFDSSRLDTPKEGKSNPKAGGTYNLYLFYTDTAPDGYKVARSVPITIPAVPSAADYEHVVIIGVDGAGAFFKNTDTPNIDKIFNNNNSAISYNVRTEDPSMSAENWASMLHGVSDEYHGINNTIAETNAYPSNSDCPSIFKVVRENYPNAKLGAFSNWSPINTGIIENGIGVDKTHGKSDAQITDAVCEYVTKESPKLVFVQFDEADKTGHSKGFGKSEQLAKITELDGYIGRIYKAYEDKGLLEKTLFIVTADHGGTPTGGHGGLTDAEINVMFAATGKTVKKGTIGDMMVRDTAAVVLHALGCQKPSSYSACVPNDLFNGVSRAPEFSFGLTDKGVSVNGNSFEIEMYIEGADDRFGHDAWFGIYDGNVTAEQLYQKGGELSQGAWDYVAQGSGRWTKALSEADRLGSQRRTFTFRSQNLDTNKSNNPAVGGTYTIFLFYTDGYDGNGYVVADSIAVTIKGTDNSSLKFGLTEKGVIVRPDGSWIAEMYLEGAGSGFRYDTWFGFYNADVTAEQLKEYKGALSQGTWGYVKNQNDKTDLNPGRYVFTFDSKDCDIEKDNPVPGKTYNVYLFPTDGNVTGDNRQYDAVTSFPIHIPDNANTGDGYLKFGFVENGVTVNVDGSWALDMYIEGADDRFDYDAWVGIYDSTVTEEELLANRSELSQGAWMYIDPAKDGIGSDRLGFTFKSSMIDTNKNNTPKTGGSYNIVLFYNDRSPNGYVVSRMIPFTLPEIHDNTKFGLTENGITVNKDGSWSVEMYIDNADGRFQHDAWYGIYDSTVTIEDIKANGVSLSQGAWGYVVPLATDSRIPALSAGSQLDTGKISFTFDSNTVTEAAEGKTNPTLGGSYNLFLFYTDHGEDQYTVARTYKITIPTEPTVNDEDINGDNGENVGGEDSGENSGENTDGGDSGNVESEPNDESNIQDPPANNEDENDGGSDENGLIDTFAKITAVIIMVAVPIAAVAGTVFIVKYIKKKKTK